MVAPRVHDSLPAEYLARHRQMAFVSGPRQVGKTTTCRLRADTYVNWDDIDGGRYRCRDVRIDFNSRMNLGSSGSNSIAFR